MSIHTSKHQHQVEQAQLEQWVVRPGQAVEDIRKYFPEFDRIAPLAFIIKTVYSVDLCALMVAAKHEKVLRIFDLITHHQTHCFNGLFSAIDIISEEEIVRLRREPTILKKTQKIVILTMDIA